MAVPAAVVPPNLLQDPGFLFLAPIGSSIPTNTVAGSVFTDAWDVAWLPLGATQDGTQFSYTTNVQPVYAAEFYDPIKYASTDRSGNVAFSLLNLGLSNYLRALNGGVAALTPTSGTGATALYDVSPTAVGGEVRAMLGWESLDHTMRLVAYQVLCSGTITSAFQKGPSQAVIPCTFNMETTSAGLIFKMSGAGASRA